MCKPRGMGIHMAWHNKQELRVAESGPAGSSTGIFGVIGSFFTNNESN